MGTISEKFLTVKSVERDTRSLGNLLYRITADDVATGDDITFTSSRVLPPFSEIKVTVEVED
jgi:hypothetical protein